MSEQQRLSPGTDSALTGKDFYDMSGPDLLAYCGDDGSKWAEAFCRIKEVQGWSAADIDQGLMIGWFANVIEHSHQVRGVAQNQKTRCENCNLLSHCGDPLCPNVGVAQRPFYGAECPSYPDCNGGCGLGCTKEIERSRGLAQQQPEPVTETGTVHMLKTWPEYFNEVLSGRKSFEWRVDDRDFKVGDTLVLQEYIPHPDNPGREGEYTDREITKTVTYIFSPWPTNKRTVVMGLARPPRTPLDLSAGELNTLATDAFREAAQASGDYIGKYRADYSPMTPEEIAQDDPALIELYTNSGATQPRGGPAQTNATQPVGSPNIVVPPSPVAVDRYAVDDPWCRPVGKTWTPDQFWEYVGGLVGEFEATQIRDMLAAKGLSITSTPRESLCECIGGSTYNDGDVRRCDLCGRPVSPAVLDTPGSEHPSQTRSTEAG